MLLTNAWRYSDGKTNPPVGWTDLAFDDTSWNLGLALIGHEDATLPAPVQSEVPPPSQNGPSTVYCRTHFNYPASLGTNGVSLVFSNLIDDGAIWHLNGREIQRLGMPPGTVTYNTFAIRTVGDATVFEVFTNQAAGSPIRIGDNVLAVETHNVNATSSDTVFATSLTARATDPLVIPRPQPEDQTGSVGTPVTFCVDVGGDDPHYQWYRNGVRVSGANGRCVNFTPRSTADSGTRFHVVVTNAIGALTSRVAVLTVIPDTFPPGLVWAFAQEMAPSNTVFVTFTEFVLNSTATNPASYRIEMVGTTNTVAVSNAVASQNTVTLRVGGPHWHWGSNYILTVTGVSDTRGNRLNGLSNRVAVSFSKEVFPMNGVSKYFDWIAAFYFHPTNLADFEATWMMPGSDDSSIHWINLRGVTYYDLNPPPSICGSWGDLIDVADDPSWPKAYYFRTRFGLPPNNGRGTIRLTASIDDGAVFYLNGVEIYRYNMPPGPVDRHTPATADVEPVDCVETSLINVTNFLSGTNILATEVHQSSDPSTLDLYFGVEIDVLSPPTVHPALRIERTDAVPDGIVVSWPATHFPGWGLLAQTPGATNWALVATNSPFQTNLVPSASHFYRLGAPPFAP